MSLRQKKNALTCLCMHSTAYSSGPVSVYPNNFILCQKIKGAEDWHTRCWCQQESIGKVSINFFSSTLKFIPGPYPYPEPDQTTSHAFNTERIFCRGGGQQCLPLSWDLASMFRRQGLYPHILSPKTDGRVCWGS